jgi:preprotein translocase subunit SecD
MDLLNDKKFLTMAALFLAFLGTIAFYGAYSGLLLILALFIYGGFCLMWKESHIKLAGLGFLVLLAVANIGLNGLKYGIDFEGGTRIPVLLEKSVDSTSMNDLLQGIKKRVSVLGLTEAKVYAVGDTQINVEIPSSDEQTIRFIEDTLSHQGVYWGIIDGKVAVSGDDIYSTSIMPVASQQLSQQRADWGVSFQVNRHGKADYPVYMFLDRPTNAALFLSRDELRKHMPDDSSDKEVAKGLSDALALDQGRNITLYIIDSLNGTVPQPKGNGTQALISGNASAEFKSSLNASGFVVKEFSEDEITPTYNRTRAGVLTVEQLSAVGLLSAPLLSQGLATGVPNYAFSVTGAVPPGPNHAVEVANNVKKIESILKGGSLPVQISLGSRTTLPASLGEEFLRLSLIAIVASLVSISLLIGLRYRNIRATLPIIAISISELIILLAILGSFTIDLAAMAGIIAAIGVGVDAQIVITDELLKKDGEETDEKMAHAFDIIKTNVVVATLSMVPLLFSGLVEVIGFAISTILGSMLGYLLSRPAYASIVGMIIERKEPGERK